MQDATYGPESSHQPLRRPSREKKKPERFGYDTSLVTKHSIYIAKDSTDEEPTTFEEAQSKKAWRDAMDEEMEALKENDTWELVPNKPSMKVREHLDEAPSIVLNGDRGWGGCDVSEESGESGHGDSPELDSRREWNSHDDCGGSGRGGASEPKICMPEKFNGDRTKFRGFLQQVKLYIRMQPDRYPDDASKVGFIGTLLYGQALSWFAPILEKDMAVLHNYEAFLGELVATFGDADTSRVAETKLRKLRQGNRPASTYASEFRQLICDLTWHEDYFISQFRWGLRDDVKDLLLTMPEVKTLNEYINQAIQCDNHLFERKQEKQVEGRPRQWKPFQPTPRDDTMPEPMQIDVTRFQPLTPQEKQRRRDNKLCLYCGNPGHIAVNCPNKRTNSKVAATLLILSKKTLSLIALVDSGASSCFIDEGLVKKHGIPVLRKNRPVVAEVVDGRPLASGNITMETIPLRVHLGDHDSHICFNVISSPANMVIIGMPWLKKHNPEINWEKNKITRRDIQKNPTYVGAKAFIHAGTPNSHGPKKQRRPFRP
ncbi:hypothetical protein KP509_29G049500 [Ceratopteris richardii]|uniref:CCHC-type domain-containing protein n=1 Tax=Ceratopteris richardii TaxID=49495 RepID=A0A8T2R961_CERRI|nr:hypothetical protein KP509_29G049500 [Ceratopteris richardii]